MHDAKYRECFLKCLAVVVCVVLCLPAESKSAKTNAYYVGLGGGLAVPLLSWPSMADEGGAFRHGYMLDGVFICPFPLRKDQEHDRNQERDRFGLIMKAGYNAFNNQKEVDEPNVAMDYGDVFGGAGVYVRNEWLGMGAVAVVLGSSWGYQNFTKDTTISFWGGDSINYEAGDSRYIPSVPFLGLLASYYYPMGTGLISISPLVEFRVGIPLPATDSESIFYDLILMRVGVQVWFKR